ncbi:CHAT domain-containing tetratricopeptide repeat protein [Halotia wernerae UHCC 0503]|nr:CHAT domain-containing tetratricopeptide repeat protein [Halotia wernerae UHCC 0503]
MHYHLKSLSLITVVLSLTLPISTAESQTRRNVQIPVIAQSQPASRRKNEVLRLNQLGIQQLSQAQFQAALKSFEKALAIAKKIGYTTGKSITLNNLGLVYIRLGQYDKALELLQQALAIRQQIDDKTGIGKTLKNVALAHYNMGRYGKALELLQQSLAIKKQIDDKEGQGNTLNSIGLVYRALGQYNKALQFHQQALAIAKKINDTDGKGAALHNIGLIAETVGEYSKALEFYQQALAITIQTRDKHSEGTALNRIGIVYAKLKDYAKALDFAKQALAIRQQIDDKRGQGTTLDFIGLVYNDLGQHNKALEFQQQALVFVREIDDKAGEAVTLNNIAGAYTNLGKYADAEKTLFAAIKVIESLRPGLTDEQKVSFFETQTSTYFFLQQVLIAQNKTNTALEIAERSRARAFVDLLASNIFGNTNNQQIIKPPSIEKIKQIAKAQNATLVEYSIHESNLYIWIIKPTGEVAFRQKDIRSLLIEKVNNMFSISNLTVSITGNKVTIGATDGKSLKTLLADLVNNSRMSIGAGGRGIDVTATGTPIQTKYLQKLHKILIEPITDYLPTNPDEKVIFIPHESLFLVPFVALQDADGKYLIEKHTILTAPAIQVLDLTHRQRQNITSKDMLIMGNPTMPKVGVPPVQLDPLKGAEQEAVNIASFFKTKAITGKDATEAVFKQKSSSAKIIHLATHGLLDDPRKNIPTAIALASTSKDDGLLTPGEIVDLPINAELVVLSACDTGRGAITGDGVIGLSRSLITAGTSSVIVSLWKVPDTQTSKLMIEFYQQWEQNPDKAVALRRAMLKTMEKYPQPINWAAFTLIGESN